MSIEINKKHVAVLAFPSSSHPQILMNITLKIANSAQNILFSFFSTKKSNNSLLSAFSDPHLPDNIKIHNVEDGVPLGYKFTGKPHEQIDLFLKSAPQNLKSAIETAAKETGIKISCIISDAFLTFSDGIAESFDTSWIAIWQALPTSLSAHFYTRIIRDKFAAEKISRDEKLDFIPGLSMLYATDLPTDIISVGEMKSVFSKTLSQIGEKLPKATAVAVNCFQEIVPEILHNDLKSKFKNYLNIGFVSMSSPESGTDKTGCLPWLDAQSSKSVAYISFGTIVTLPEKEIKELAEALESVKIPFLWSLKDNLTEKLPKGFIERTKGQGKIVPWAPQNLVLAHDSVGVFISHGGYNSISESIVHGVPMICRPVFADQMVMARMVEDFWGIGVKVEDGAITKDRLLKDLEVFFRVDDERGKKMRENVEEMKKVVLMAALPNGCAAKDFNKLVEIISMA